MTELSTLRVELTPPTAKIRLTRPESLNAINVRMRDELLGVVDSLPGEGVMVASLTGEGRAFCAGGDLAEMGASQGGDEAEASLSGSHRLLYSLAGSPVVFVAAVNGLAYGAGFSLVLACDVAVASEAAVFSQAFTGAGLVPDMGSAAELGRLVGRQTAAYLMLTNRTVSAAEALRIGVVAAVLPADDFEEEVDGLLDDLATRPPLALRGTKALLRTAFPVDAAALELEKQLQARASESPEHQSIAEQFRHQRT